MLTVTFAVLHIRPLCSLSLLLSVTYKLFMLTVVMLNVVVLSVVAPMHPRPKCDRKKFVSSFVNANPVVATE